MNKYWIFRCKSCGSWTIKFIKTSVHGVFFSCQWCKKRLKINPKNRFGLSMQFVGPYKTRFIADNICDQKNWGRKC